MLREMRPSRTRSTLHRSSRPQAPGAKSAPKARIGRESSNREASAAFGE